MAWLADAEKQLSEIERTLESHIQHGENGFLDDLRKRRVKALELRDWLAKEVECLRRLVQDSRMQDVYAKLRQEHFDDKKQCNFILSAWAAYQDYSKYRIRLKQVEELRIKIVKTSEKLAEFLQQAADTGFNFWPPEFFSIPELLHQTDNHDMEDHNLYMWRSMRGYILGDKSKHDASSSESAEEIKNKTSGSEIVFVAANKDDDLDVEPDPFLSNTMQYAWKKAPDLSALLNTVTTAAKEFHPREDGMVLAAIDSRKSNEKMEYIRAFSNLLTDNRHFSLTPGIMQAIAITTTVVINQPDIDASYDDVRNALRKSDS